MLFLWTSVNKVWFRLGLMPPCFECSCIFIFLANYVSLLFESNAFPHVPAGISIEEIVLFLDVLIRFGELFYQVLNALIMAWLFCCFIPKMQTFAGFHVQIFCFDSFLIDVIEIEKKIRGKLIKLFYFEPLFYFFLVFIFIHGFIFWTCLLLSHADFQLIAALRRVVGKNVKVLLKRLDIRLSTDIDRK